MAEHKLLLPSMGEGVMEATIIGWLFKEGDFVNEDDSVVEIATDKVDSDVPTPVSGRIVKILKEKDEIAKVGEPIAILEIEGEEVSDDTSVSQVVISEEVEKEVVEVLEKPLQVSTPNILSNVEGLNLSPLVRSIIQEENISEEELRQIKGRGLEGRITKEDILEFVNNRGKKLEEQKPAMLQREESKPASPAPVITTNDGDEIIQMDRMRKIIAENMLMSKQISPHVSSFIESDVTNIVKWRGKKKNAFEKEKG